MDRKLTLSEPEVGLWSACRWMMRSWDTPLQAAVFVVAARVFAEAQPRETQALVRKELESRWGRLGMAGSIHTEDRGRR